jgi:hypothetical protein
MIRARNFVTRSLKNGLVWEYVRNPKGIFRIRLHFLALRLLAVWGQMMVKLQQ